MRRPAQKLPKKLSADSQRLITFAEAIVQASSRLEERGWERNLEVLLLKLLKQENQETIDTAMEHLFHVEPMAYDALMESIEAISESCIIEHAGAQYDALLIAAPILAWTRFSIASGPIASDALLTLSAHFNAHLLASDVQLAMMPTLFSIDQLPRTYAETYALTHRIGEAALAGKVLQPAANAPETAPFLADTRYLLAVVTVPLGAPMFRWQSSADLTDRTTAAKQWRAQATPTVTRILPGCGIDLILPEAYYIACREADKQIRPVSIRAAVYFLTHALDVEPDQLQVVIGNFGDSDTDERVDEYRISFLLDQESEVVYGTVWPLLGAENAEEEPLGILSQGRALDDRTSKRPIDEILATLQEVGIIHIKHLSEYFPMEFCDDCGGPLFADRDAELVHAEMPEDVPQNTEHFH